MSILISSPIAAPPDSDETETSGIELGCTSGGDVLRVRLTGEVDHFTAAPLRITLAAAAVYGYRHVELDTTAVTFCDSALLSALSGWCSRGRTLSHTATSATVHRLLALDRDLALRKAPCARGATGR
ncbi:STAS domain-containing protein [Streptomyces sp. NPDC058874]|uniref:STAS domain-containing protein n=1 Tax=unclassified Streptomyces TaxID=2593676 RepID=UPI0036A2228D